MGTWRWRWWNMHGVALPSTTPIDSIASYIMLSRVHSITLVSIWMCCRYLPRGQPSLPLILTSNRLAICCRSQSSCLTKSFIFLSKLYFTSRIYFSNKILHFPIKIIHFKSYIFLSKSYISYQNHKFPINIIHLQIKIIHQNHTLSFQNYIFHSKSYIF